MATKQIPDDDTSPASEKIAAIIEECLPDGDFCGYQSQGYIGNEYCFRFAQRLKRAFPQADPQDMKDVFTRWYNESGETLEDDTGEHMSYIEAWAKFLDCWDKVKYASGGALAEARAKLPTWMTPWKKSKIPHADRYPDDKMRMLLALCYELQQIAGDDTFYLASRDAGSVIGTSAPTANAFIKMLIRDRVLMLVEPHTTHRARRLRFVSDPHCR